MFPGSQRGNAMLGRLARCFTLRGPGKPPVPIPDKRGKITKFRSAPRTWGKIAENNKVVFPEYFFAFFGGNFPIFVGRRGKGSVAFFGRFRPRGFPGPL